MTVLLLFFFWILFPQENKNFIQRVPLTSRTAVFQKAYAEIEQYIMTKKTPKAQDKPGEVIMKIHKDFAKREKKSNVQVMILNVPWIFTDSNLK